MSGSTLFLYIRRQFFAQHTRYRNGPELPLLDRDQNVLASGDDHIRPFVAMDFEVQMNRAPADFPKIRIHDEQFIECHRMEKITLHVHARQPDPELVEERAIRQPAVAEQLHFGESEKSEVRLIVDDSRRVDIFPADIFVHGETHRIRSMKRMLSILLFASSAFGAENLIAIKAARLIDGRGGAVVSPAVIVVRGNRIESIGVAIPAGAQTIDLGDMTLLPGLIDAHTHILLQGDVTSADYDEQLFRESMPYRALRASRAVRIALDHGFTSLRDVETEGAMYTDVDVKRAINNGIIPGPRLFVS